MARSEHHDSVLRRNVEAWAAAGSVLTSVVTGLACAAPLLAILLGVSGLGFLTRYAWLRGPATVATVVLLAVGFFFAYRAPRRGGATHALLWVACVIAIAIHVFEYVVFPHLA